MFTPIVEHIKKHVPLNDSEQALLLNLLQYRELKKKSYLLKAGEVCTENYFIVSGCFRLYIVNDKGIEQVIQFGIENWWITEYMSLKSKKPSVFTIQAIEDASVIIIDDAVQETLFKEIPQLERYFRIVMEKAYAAQLMRINYIFNLSGEERYRLFSKAQPQFVQRVPQYLLASYLGITPEFLSRIRAKRE